jgi:hypothetical protein
MVRGDDLVPPLLSIFLMPIEIKEDFPLTLRTWDTNLNHKLSLYNREFAICILLQSTDWIFPMQILNPIQLQLSTPMKIL